MELVKRWKAYRGFTDERVEIEMNRIYKAGFLMLLGGYVVYLYYALALKQVQMMVDVMSTGTGNMSLALPELLLFAWFLITLIYCSVRQCRKGIVDDGRFAEVDEFPGGYFALVSGLAALGAGVLSALVHVIATLQVGGSMDYFALIIAAQSVSIAILTFGGCMLAFYLSFRSAKNSREKAALQFDDE